MSAVGFERMIRWYPSEWRARYGGELTALLEDTYACASDVPLHDRMDLLRSGVAERARSAGFVGERDPVERVRSGSVLVLCGWALFLVAGALFGKFTDNWRTDTPVAGRWVAAAGYHAVAVAGAIGCIVVALAALMALPVFVRLVLAGGWASVRRPVLRAVTAFVTAALLLSGALVWAHHLSRHDRNGGLALYGALFLLVSLATVVAIGSGTSAAVSVARRLELSPRSLRRFGGLALALAGAMAVELVGVVTWWVSEAIHAPGMLSTGIGGGLPFTSGTVPPTLLAAGFLMVLGLVLALPGTAQVAVGLRRRPAP